MPQIPVEQRLHAFAKQRHPFPSNTERWKLEATRGLRSYPNRCASHSADRARARVEKCFSEVS
jgi:hypothetical protein